MKSFIADIIPKLQRFSNKLDNKSLLINQHWVVFDGKENSKNVYIFRAKNELLISHNGKVEKARWEYLGNNSLLIDKRNDSFLFKHGFFDEKILVLKTDSSNEYAFLINENKYDGKLESIECIIDFLKVKYIESGSKHKEKLEIEKANNDESQILILKSHNSDKGILEIEQTHDLYSEICTGRNVFLNGKPAPNGKYKLGFMWYITINDGQVLETSFL